MTDEEKISELRKMLDIMIANLEAYVLNPDKHSVCLKARAVLVQTAPAMYRDDPRRDDPGYF